MRRRPTPPRPTRASPRVLRPRVTLGAVLLAVTAHVTPAPSGAQPGSRGTSGGSAPRGTGANTVGTVTSDTAVARAETRAAPRGAWRPLFDGRTLAGWRGYRSTGIPAGWRVENGVLTKSVATGDLATVAQYGDFELAFDWKLSEGGNAGLFYRVTEEYEHPYWSGPEYQLLDDAHHADGRDRRTAAGAAHGLYPAPAGVVRPAEQWNSARIVVRGDRVEHWLNGRRTAAYTLGGAEWTAKVKASKFGEWPSYGRARRGHVVIQGDHDGTLALRNLRIREL